jgi:hypothetical protein
MKLHFKHYSNKAAKDAAFNDMKEAHVNYNLFFKERTILNANIQIVRI